MLIIIAIVIFCGMQASELSEKPQALQAMEQARLSLFSGDVCWTYTNHVRNPGREFTFINRYAANGDLIFEERGDQDGWVTYNDTEPFSKLPQLYLKNADGTWHAEESNPYC